MKVHFSSRDSWVMGWQQRGVERLRQALRYLQRLLAVDRQPKALALIPIRAVHPHVARQPHRRTWRD
jgi:hypothetical protein